MTDSHQDPKLGYADARTNCPVDTRIVIEESPTKIRYIDPAGSVDAMASQSVFGMVALFVGLIMFFVVVMPSGFTKNAVAPAAVVLGFTFMGIKFLRNSRRYSTQPTIIEIDKATLTLIHPVSGSHQWPLDDISKIYCKWSIAWRPDWRYTLWINARNRAYSVLAWRDPDEAEWLADLLRHKCGLEN